MAKKNKSNLITSSFHYLAKSVANENDPSNPIEQGFSKAEFQRIVDRISDPVSVDERDEDVIRRIKSGQELPFGDHNEIEQGLHFGNFEGAYYGQRYRNNRLGVVPAESLNLRQFNYLITRLRDGRVLVGTTYHGQFGDYEGMRSCLCHILGGNVKIASKALRSISAEIGEGIPTEINLHYRKQGARAEARSLFGSTGVIGVKATEFGDGFAPAIERINEQVRGDIGERKRRLAEFVNEGELIALDADDIIGCTAIVRQDGRNRTVYLLGENNFATKFALNVNFDNDGIPDRTLVRDEMVRIMRTRILPMLE